MNKSSNFSCWTYTQNFTTKNLNGKNILIDVYIDYIYM